MVALAITNDMVQRSFYEACEPILCVTWAILDHFHRTSSQLRSIKSKRFSTYCLSLCTIDAVPTWLICCPERHERRKYGRRDTFNEKCMLFRNQGHRSRVIECTETSRSYQLSGFTSATSDDCIRLKTVQFFRFCQKVITF